MRGLWSSLRRGCLYCGRFMVEIRVREIPAPSVGVEGVDEKEIKNPEMRRLAKNGCALLPKLE